MCLNKSARTGRDKKFYIFFTFAGKYSGCYAEIRASCFNNAQLAAWKAYSYADVGSIEKDEERAKAKIQAFGLKSWEGLKA